MARQRTFTEAPSARLDPRGLDVAETIGNSVDNEAVEAHTAMIIFKSSDRLAVHGWTVDQLDDAGFEYIRLTGEHLTITSDAPNGAITPTSDQLPLAKLGGTLSPPFQPPYSGAAAVITMTQGNLSTCSRSSRVDTTLTLNADFAVTISAPGGKSLTLQAGGQYYIANIPMRYAKQHDGTVHGGVHLKVYCAMTGSNCDQVILRMQAATAQNMCGSAFKLAGGHPPDAPAMIDFACSNSSWP